MRACLAPVYPDLAGLHAGSCDRHVSVFWFNINFDSQTLAISVVIMEGTETYKLLPALSERDAAGANGS